MFAFDGAGREIYRFVADRDVLEIDNIGIGKSTPHSDLSRSQSGQVGPSGHYKLKCLYANSALFPSRERTNIATEACGNTATCGEI